VVRRLYQVAFRVNQILILGEIWVIMNLEGLFVSQCGHLPIQGAKVQVLIHHGRGESIPRIRDVLIVPQTM